LKVIFIIAPLLILVNLFKPFILEINVFNFALDIAFSQLGENLFHPIDFHFPINTKYKIHDKNSWPLWMPLRSCVIYSKKFNMKSLCIYLIKISNILWLFMFWINIKLDGHCHCQLINQNKIQNLLMIMTSLNFKMGFVCT